MYVNKQESPPLAAHLQYCTLPGIGSVLLIYIPNIDKGLAMEQYCTFRLGDGNNDINFRFTYL
jgi:hypothetical protein